MTSSRSMVRSWWRYRVDYRWLIETFEAHSALGPLKFMMGWGGIVMGSITLLALASQGGQRGVAGDIQAVVVAVTAALWTLRWWLFAWPRETESLMWVAVVDIAVTANNVMVQDRLLGAMGCVLLVTTGGYITIFHGPPVLALHVGFAVLSILALAAMMVAGGPGGSGHGRGDLALGAMVVLVILVVTGVVLPVVQFCNWLLRLDALSDPLTKVLNRRGLDSHLTRLFRARGRDHGVYVVTLDLDRFKSVNDTFGHSFGDEVLVRTAECLCAAAPPGAVVVRTGGEEFVVVGRLHGADLGAVAERLRQAVESMPRLPQTITASVGAARIDPVHTGDSRRVPIDRTVFHTADSAMYRAKQLGGNAVVIAEPVPRPESARRETPERR
ncbi:GGDEF domain-containing protein [Nocardia brasiliensis]|uniref:GGDEF domain-containing protein n=1 Tax=Nocardia brasiliensis TaxID=37326 RepID=UPI0009DD7B63|nr:GGDEF domain-containing protein [Nocardia brasiliensis]ASF12967.1 GGDEF domain-containing protein [Nocardia brasiliensis]